MADHHHQHHHHLRPNRISVPPRTPSFSSATTTATTTTTSSRQYPLYPYASSTPTPTPSKQPRFSSFTSINNRSSTTTTTTNSLSFLFLVLFSLRSLYSLLPFLRSSSPSFSIFPFSFLVSLLSFLLTFSFSIFSSSPSKTPFQQQSQQPIFALASITQSQHRLLIAKSFVLAVVFVLRFQALRYCGTAATILAELTGNVAARFVAEGRSRSHSSGRDRKSASSKVRGFLALFVGLFLLSISWDRIECFPLSSVNVGNGGGFSVLVSRKCVRVLPMLLPFLSGFLSCYERVSMNWIAIRQLGRKRVRLISLFYTTLVLFFPAVISLFMLSGDGVSIGNLGWPLANIVVFGVLLSENFGDDKLMSSTDYQRDFVVTFVCTLVLELCYFPELSLWGLLLCGFLLWISVRELDVSSKYPELGSDSSDSFSSMIMKPIRHILSERKSRKIALFLFINTVYMVVEFVVGFMSNSLGLLSDASHMLFDCAALAIGLYASYISRLPANSQFNYGRGRFEVLSGYVNAVFLVLVGALIVLESLERILDPQEISTSSLLVVSVGGLVVNVVGLIFFHEEHHHAHGGAGSCSHSHSHQHSHSDSHSHQHLHSHSHAHDQDNHNHAVNLSTSHQDQQCQSVHLDCGHHDGHRDDHHDHDHDHGHTHKDDHHECGHAHKHDHHHHADQHSHHNPMVSVAASGSSLKHSVEASMHKSHVHGSSCSHKDITSSLNTHSLQSDIHNRSSLGNSSSQLQEPLLKEPQKQHKHIDHNMEGIFLHVLADTLGSVGVVISTLLIKYKGWLIADPACSIFISVLIISSVISLLRNSGEVLLQRVPRAHEQELKVALDDVRMINGVHSIENVHVWSFTNTDVIGTLSLHVSADTDKASTKAQVSHILHDAGIKDLTIQMEYVRDK